MSADSENWGCAIVMTILILTVGGLVALYRVTPQAGGTRDVHGCQR